MRARIFWSRRSLWSRRNGTKEDGEDECSMKIANDVRGYAAENKISPGAVITKGFEEKAAEFAKAGEIFQKV